MTHAQPDGKLLAGTDPAPVILAGDPLAPGPLVLLGDHAGREIPRSLGTMGLSEEDRHRHIAWDIGTALLGRQLGQRLGAPFVSQGFSRLVVDCNRDPGDPQAVLAISDGTRIPANEGLGGEQRAQRLRAVHEPYHRAIAELLDARAGWGLRSVLVALHSFTPVYGGAVRVWDAGVLHGGPGDGYGRRVLGLLQRRGERWVIGDNLPYAFDGTDYTIPRHAFARGLEWMELELRQDHLATAARLEAVADWLAPMLVEALVEGAG